MEKSLKEKFDNINLDELPDSIRFEIETIQEETSDFTDEDAIEVFQKNFNYLYFSISKKHPMAMKDYAESEGKRRADEFIALISSGDNSLSLKDFDSALSSYDDALKTGVNNSLAKERVATAQSEKVKHDKIVKAKEIAGKYKKIAPVEK